MNNREILDLCKDRVFTNEEIIEFLTICKPVSFKQSDAIARTAIYFSDKCKIPKSMNKNKVLPLEYYSAINTEDKIKLFRNCELTIEQLIDLISGIKLSSPDEEKLVIKFLQNLYEKKDYINPLTEYLSTFKQSDFIGRIISECYEEYCTWCELNYMTPETRILFTKGIKEHFKLESKVTTIEQKRVRVFRII